MTDMTAQSVSQNLMADKPSRFSLSGISIRNLLLGGFAVTCLVLVVAMGTSILGAQKEAEHVSTARDYTIPATLAMSELHRQIVESEAQTGKWIATGDTVYTERLEKSWSHINELQSKIDQSLPYLNGEYNAVWLGFKNNLQEFKAAQDRVVEVANSPAQFPGKQIVSQSVHPASERIGKDIGEMIDAERAQPASEIRKQLSLDLAEAALLSAKRLASLESYLITGRNEELFSFENDNKAFSNILTQIGSHRNLFTGEQQRLYNTATGDQTQFINAVRQVVTMRQSPEWDMAGNLMEASVIPAGQKLIASLVGEAGILPMITGELNGSMTELVDDASSLSITLWSLLIAGVLITIGAGLITMKSVLSPLANLANMVLEIAEGRNVEIPGQGRSDELGRLARSLQLIVETSRENLRNKTALDSVRTNVMVADENYNIVYVNKTMIDMLNSNEGNMRKDLPAFDAAKVVGSNIDVFHKNPAHQRKILDGIRGDVETSLFIGGRNYDLVVSPVMDKDGIRIGTVVEWADVTEQTLRVQEEQRVSRENSRIKSALDSCRTNVMVADADHNIVYVNDTMLEMLRQNENDMRKDLPNFRAEKIVGTNIDTFHKNPAHQRGMLSALTTTHEANLSIGGRAYDLVVSPILDADHQRIGTVVEWEDVTVRNARRKEEQRIANENSRIKSALDNCSTNMMVADAGYNIVYINNTMREMLHGNESNMRSELPQFDAAKVVGSNIDIFHKNPAHQRGMLDRLSGAFNTNIEVGGKYYNLIASPVMSDDGERIGTVVEWADVTAEKLIEQEIDGVVNAAVAGDFSNKLDLHGKEGFMLRLSEAINSLSGTVSSAMEDVGDALSALASGDLTKRITADYQGLFDQLKSNTNGTSEQLTNIVSDIVTAASEVANAAQEINMGTMDLSQRTEQQASNLEETAAAMEEMSSTVKQNAENAQQANQLSVSAREVAERGGGVVGEVVEAMSRIESSSQKISDIISVIDEIAFQTNLLALNAAVEAARAGDAGKGFAVVAAEVGTLAQRSSQAAKDIKGLINDSGNQVKDGVRLVGNAGQSLTEIVDSIKRLSDIVSEIAAASNEQSTSISEINRSVSQMDEMTQQNSALVEENAAASRTLQEQSESMRDRISFFKLDNNAPAPQKRAVARPHSTSKSHGGSSMAMPMMAMSNGQSAAEDWSEF